MFKDFKPRNHTELTTPEGTTVNVLFEGRVVGTAIVGKDGVIDGFIEISDGSVAKILGGSVSMSIFDEV